MEIHAGTLGSFPVVTEIRYPAPRRIEPSRWTGAERRMFACIKVHYRTDSPPLAFLEAIRDHDVPGVVAQVKSILDSDLPISERLERHCYRWLNARTP